MITLYGISNCDTIRKARNWMTDNDVNYEFSDFRKNPLKIEQIENWLASTPIEALVNKRSQGWKALTAEQQIQLMKGESLSLMVETPTLIKRPVLEKNQQVIHLGFNASDYQTIFA